jgi:hypothetical protein
MLMRLRPVLAALMVCAVSLPEPGAAESSLRRLNGFFFLEAQESNQSLNKLACQANNLTAQKRDLCRQLGYLDTLKGVGGTKDQNMAAEGLRHLSVLSG